jgi:hypothetical protein
MADETVVLLFETEQDAKLALPYLGEDVMTCRESFRESWHVVCF